MTKKKNKKSEPKPTTTEPVEEEEAPEPTGPSISITELNALGMGLMQGAMSIDQLSPEDQRTQIMNESWELTQLQIKQTARIARRDINDKLVEFLQQFPEALEPLKQQLANATTTQGETEEE
jgi:hypothetical protein